MLHLTGVPDDAVIANDDVFADVGVVADAAIAPDDRGTDDHGTMFDDSALPDEHIHADIGGALRAVVLGRAKVLGEVSLKTLEHVPRKLNALEQGGVFGLG
jgi:hypothetical protein